jgi:hypothetical protein
MEHIFGIFGFDVKGLGPDSNISSDTARIFPNLDPSSAGSFGNIVRGC